RKKDDLLQAFWYAEAALMSNERVYGPDSVEAGRSLRELGDVLQELYAYRAAIDAYQRALPIFTRTRGMNHPETGVVLQNMAQAMAEDGDLDAAAALLIRSEAIKNRTYGPMDEMFGLFNLGNLRERQGRLDEAADLTQRAFALGEKNLRPG